MENDVMKTGVGEMVDAQMGVFVVLSKNASKQVQDWLKWCVMLFLFFCGSCFIFNTQNNLFASKTEPVMLTYDATGNYYYDATYGVIYDLYNGDMATVSGYREINGNGDVVIQNQVSDGVNVYNVTEIGNDAFNNWMNLKRLDLSQCEHLYIMGENVCYNCKELTVVIMSKCVTDIDDSVFEKCDKLQLVVVIDGVVEFPEKTFGYSDYDNGWVRYDFFTVKYINSQSETVMTQLVFTGGDKPVKAANPAEYAVAQTNWLKGGQVFDFETQITEDVILCAAE